MLAHYSGSDLKTAAQLCRAVAPKLWCVTMMAAGSLCGLAQAPSYTAIQHPITIKILREIGRSTRIGQVERLLNAKAPAETFDGTHGKCSEYKFMYGTNITADHVTIQQCDNGYFSVRGTDHDGYSLTENNEGLFDCHDLGYSASAAEGWDACPKD